MAVVYDTRQRGTLACAYPTPEVAFAQGTGLGKLLLDFAETEAHKAGFDSIYLYTHEKMTENRALYQGAAMSSLNLLGLAAFSRLYEKAARRGSVGGRPLLLGWAFDTEGQAVARELAVPRREPRRP